jgi:hypothetical protein
MFKKVFERGEPLMGVAVTYVAYLAISIALTVFVGSALSRSGRVFLRDVFGDQAAPAEAASRLIVVGFYLLSLGFITLTMRMSGEIGSARQGIQVLSVKIGEVLLVLGVLYLANIGFLARLRHRIQAQALQLIPEAGRPERGVTQPPERAAARAASMAGTTTAGTTTAGTTTAGEQAGQAAPAKAAAQGLWRPRPRQAIH